MTTEMKMETRSLASLRPAEYNPRVQLQPADPEYQNIKRSIETFGYVDPIIINQDGTIIGGHQRYNVMKDLGYTEAQVVVVDLDKNNEKALNIALNKITGEWDEIKLKDLLLDLDLNDYDLTATGTRMWKPKMTTSMPTQTMNPSRSRSPSAETSGSWETTGSCAEIPPTSATSTP